MSKKNEPLRPQSLFAKLNHRGITWIILWIILTFMMHNVLHNFWVPLTNSTIIVCFAIMLVLFVNEILISRLLARGRNFWFYFCCIVLVVPFSGLELLIEIFVDHQLLNYEEYHGISIFGHMYVFPLLARLSIFSGAIFISVVDHMQRKADDNRRLSEQLKSEKLDMELRYLKSQINPHFLFNALNNVYSLVYTHDEKAPDSVLKLSEMLRYVMVDCQAETLPLKKETAYISNYIDFQIMHCEHHPNIVFEQDVENLSFMIHPMILQPIVENCFKHSRISSDANGFIRVSLVQNSKRLMFRAENSVATSVVPVVAASNHDSGIGLANVRKRLELFYGKSFTLDAGNCGNVFVVELVINIS